MSSSGNTLSLNPSLEKLKGRRLAIISTEWNEEIVKMQIAGCKKICDEVGVKIAASWKVPGSFELPFGVRKMWAAIGKMENPPEAIITFGAVIRGGTPHFEYVSQAVTTGILQLNLNMPIPIIFGVLTLDRMEQAYERLGGVHGHKGEEAAITALKMMALGK